MLILLCEEEHFMGMGWKEANYSLEINRRKCGAGYTVMYEHICKESNYPSFTKGVYQYTVCECKNKCES